MVINGQNYSLGWYKLQEFVQPIKAGHVLSQNPKCFLCNSEFIYVDSFLAKMTEEEQLQPGQIYFLMPHSKSQMPFSLQELCELAIKARAALAHHMGYPSEKLFQVSNKNVRLCFRVPIQ